MGGDAMRIAGYPLPVYPDTNSTVSQIGSRVSRKPLPAQLPAQRIPRSRLRLAPAGLSENAPDGGDQLFRSHRLGQRGVRPQAFRHFQEPTAEGSRHRDDLQLRQLLAHAPDDFDALLLWQDQIFRA